VLKEEGKYPEEKGREIRLEEHQQRDSYLGIVEGSALYTRGVNALLVEGRRERRLGNARVGLVEQPVLLSRKYVESK